MTRLNNLKDIRPLTEQTDKMGITALQFVQSYKDSVAYTDGTSLPPSTRGEGAIMALSMVGESSLTTLELGAEAEKLQYLSLSGQKNLKKVVFETVLPKLTHLYLDNCGLTEIRIPAGCEALKQIYLQGNKLTKIVFEGDCSELELLDLSNNKLTEFRLPEGFKELKYVYLNKNSLEKIGTANLPQLNILNLDDNQLSKLPFDFKLLESNGVELFLSGHPVVHLESLRLSGNPLPDDIRGFVEKSKNCLTEVQNYFQDLSKGYASDNEYKTLIIGNGNVGKSCLVHRLIRNKFKKEWDSTHGIALEQYKTKDFVFNLWDFGGQDIYHATHRLFMKSNALYLVLWDLTTEEKNLFTEHKIGDHCLQYENYPLSYWLDYTKNQGENSPVIVIQTKIKADGEKELPHIRAQYQDQFPLLKFEYIESADDDWDENGYDKLLSSMRSAAKKFNRDSKTPKNRADLRQILRLKQKANIKRLSIKDYLALAKELQIQDPMSVLKNWLDKTGVVFYREGLFENKIILDQAWAIDAVYTIFRRTNEKGRRNRTYYDIQGQNGRFTGADLQDIWEEKKYILEEQKLFVSYMLSCEICFETTQEEHPDKRDREIDFNQRSFVAPQLMSEEKPNNIEEYIWFNRPSWYLTYRHDFLHYGIIQSFIIRTQTLAEKGDIWKSGISLKKNNHLALVECGKKEIKVRVTEGGKDLLNGIRNLLENIQDGKGTETVSLDGENYVLLSKLSKLKDNSSEWLETESGNMIKKAPLMVFLERDEKIELIEPIKEEEMTLNEAKKQALKYIGDGKIEKAINVMELWASKEGDTDANMSITRIKSCWNSLQKDIGKGILSYDTRTTRENVILDNVLEFKWTSNMLESLPESQPNIDKKKAIIFLAAVGKDKYPIGASSQKQNIQNIVKEVFDFKDNLNTKCNEIRSLLKNREIIHITVHGNSDELFFIHNTVEGEDNPVNWEYLRSQFEQTNEVKDLVMLIACNSEKIAQNLFKKGVAKYVIGTTTAITPKAAIDFSTQFYTLLKDSYDIPLVFKNTCDDLNLDKLRAKHQDDTHYDYSQVFKLFH